MGVPSSQVGTSLDSLTLTPLDHAERTYLFIIGSVALASAISTCAIFGLITHRLLTRQGAVYNQCFFLIYNLIIADFFQASAFLISFHWVHKNGIFARTSACEYQGAFINLGDVSSGLSVFAIALHTVYTALRSHRDPLSPRLFFSLISLIWIISILLTILGPSIYGAEFFACAGNWCWINPNHETSRLAFHYVWIFMVEFGVVVIYLGLWIYIKYRIHLKKRAGASTASSKKMSRVARYLIMYAIAYVMLTLPLAQARMQAFSGNAPSRVQLAVAGTLLSSAGWVDSLLYTFTRRILTDSESASTSGSRTSRWSRTKARMSQHDGGDRSSQQFGTFMEIGSDKGQLLEMEDGRGRTVTKTRAEFNEREVVLRQTIEVMEEPITEPRQALSPSSMGLRDWRV